MGGSLRPVGKGPSFIRPESPHDRRYVHVHRPVVLTGGELSLNQLDLMYDPQAKVYQAPFQMKANGGVLIVDDFGRQRVPPRDLLNRWIVPLERKVDYLTLHTGIKFPVPFDCLLVFATNIDPNELVEEAFLRRIHYKIRVDSPTRAQYEEIFRRCCEERGLAYSARSGGPGLPRFLRSPPHRPARLSSAGHPRAPLRHRELQRDDQPSLGSELLDVACRSYFLELTPGR